MKIRIAVAVGPAGSWSAYGSERDDDLGMKETVLALLPYKSRPGSVIYWITAEVPVPQPVEIEGRVEV